MLSSPTYGSRFASPSLRLASVPTGFGSIIHIADVEGGLSSARIKEGEKRENVWLSEHNFPATEARCLLRPIVA